MCKMYGIIEDLCTERGIKPGKMCSDLGISRGIMGDLKAGRTKKLSAENLEKISNYFGVSSDYLLGNAIFGSELESILAAESHRLDIPVDELKYQFLRRRGDIRPLNKESISEYFDSIYNKEAPAESGKRSVSDDDIMFALWGDTDDVDKDDLDDVKRYAAFVRERKRKK